MALKKNVGPTEALKAVPLLRARQIVLLINMKRALLARADQRRKGNSFPSKKAY
jgi:hypothetical protein